MTAGTKIFLAVFAAFIGVLVLYYGVLSPDGDPAAAISATTSMHGETAPGPTPGRLKPNPRANDRLDSPDRLDAAAAAVTSSGLLTESIRGMIDQMPPTSGIVGPPAELAVGQPPVEPELHSALIANQGISLSDPAPDAAAVRPVMPDPTPQTRQQSLPTAKRIASSSSTTEYSVQSGDTMSSIAEDWFGDRHKWSLIARENPLADPNHLKIGQKLRLPPKDAKSESIKTASKTAMADRSTYTVRSGDTLAKIARELYGDVAKWESIYDANRSAIGDDPANLKPGMKLALPAKK